MDKIKMTQKEFDEVYEVEKPEEPAQEDKGEESVLDEKEQVYDDKLKESLEWNEEVEEVA